jgi:hypothetical protein
MWQDGVVGVEVLEEIPTDMAKALIMLDCEEDS